MPSCQLVDLKKKKKNNNSSENIKITQKLLEITYLLLKGFWSSGPQGHRDKYITLQWSQVF